ncbi:hypothetical protein STEG23_034023 [Scotinomys teguina]
MMELGDWDIGEWGSGECNAEPMELCEAGDEPRDKPRDELGDLGDEPGDDLGDLGDEPGANPGSEPESDPDACKELESAWPQSHECWPQTDSEHGKSLVMTPNPTELEPQTMLTELGPQEAVPLDLDPEDTDWTQAFQWRQEIFRPCPHRLIIPPMSWWEIFNEKPFPGQPFLLELSPLWPVDPLEAEGWLVDLKFAFLLNVFDTGCYMLSMIPCWAVRTRVKRWQVLLDPDEVEVAQLQRVPEQQDLQRWKLSILKFSELGVELVPADYILQKGGFKVHSYLPWHSSTPEVWSREPEEGLPIIEVSPAYDLEDFEE